MEMKIYRQLRIVALCLLTLGFTNSVEVADKPYGSESDIARLNQPNFIMPQPLSELIVRPEEIHVPIDKDPFEPVVKVEPPELTAQKRQQEKEVEVFKTMDYIGMVKVGEKFFALIKTPETKKVYQVSDRIGPWAITHISETKIGFQNGGKIYQLQRGDK
ncbi:MAG: hypothetical protein JNN05_04200 [Candidatus Omnitrophica bacterium]|nr:hypothetical protein [Candidatus Omnitrophota bacterium]